MLAVLPAGDRALWSTAFFAGLRRGELMALDVNHVFDGRPHASSGVYINILTDLSGLCETIPPLLVARHRRAADTRVAEPPRNWALLLGVVLCVEFWLIVTSYLAQNL